MKKVFFLAGLLSAISLSAQITEPEITISNYSPTLLLKRNTDIGGYIQGVQSQLQDGTNNWYFGNDGPDYWVVAKGDYTGRKLVITSEGNVGVGSPNLPSYRLQANDGMVAAKINNTAISPDNKVGFTINDTGTGIFDLSYAKDGLDIVKINTMVNKPISIGTNNIERMRITANGNVGIGSKNPDALLSVKGLIHANEVKVDLAVPADYVFQKYYTGNSALKPEYKMPTLDEVEKFTKENNHLPNVPSAKEIQTKGLNVGEMSNLLLQKIEELTLYTIEQNKALKEQNKAIQEQNEIIKEQQKRIEKLENSNK
ncbi:putative coiled-coil protein SlyX [Chryseobacterium ginsenosidimutans]|uniref:hypothetical protein n=1 Tax=Chryseobacterium ginsenosidimutans TaxID=687846 RepID=UPI0027889C47|nr:hypothetical protein [Chryseobacterium ginsenosidimutans]MDQ0591966.1 putative coiled-coil protein SlyX [Chryseobacterium ginsenosidimutans]